MTPTARTGKAARRRGKHAGAAAAGARGGAPAQTSSRSRWTAWLGGRRRSDVVAATILIVSLVALVLPARGSRAGLAVETARTDGGRPIARLDHAHWLDICRNAGLPDPPNLNGTDPVPAGRIASLIARWVEARDGEALGALGQAYQALEEHGAARLCFAAAAGLDRDEPLWVYLLGAECQDLGREDEAIAALRAAQALDPAYGATYARLGQLHLDRGDLAEAEAAYREYGDRAKTSALGPIGLGRIALARSAWPEAEAHFREAVAISPGDYLAHRFLARAVALLGRRDEAARIEARSSALPFYRGWSMFDERRHESERVAGTHRSIENDLRIALARQQWHEAKAAALALLERRPDDSNTLCAMASIERKLNAFDDAEATIERALALRPDGANLHLVRAEIAFSRQDFAAAHASLDHTLALDPASARAWDVRGRTLVLESRALEGVEALRRSISLDPAQVETRFVLADVLQQLGRREAAIIELRALLQIDPAYEQARTMLTRLESGLTTPSQTLPSPGGAASRMRQGW